MTNDINHRLATELMGFKLTTIDYKDGYSWTYWAKPGSDPDNDDFAFEAVDKYDPPYWNPTEDLNHARMCLLKLGEMGLAESLVEELSLSNNYIHVLRGGDYLSYQEIFHLLTEPPQQICEAICKVLDKVKTNVSS